MASGHHPNLNSHVISLAIPSYQSNHTMLTKFKHLLRTVRYCTVPEVFAQTFLILASPTMINSETVTADKPPSVTPPLQVDTCNFCLCLLIPQIKFNVLWFAILGRSSCMGEAI